MTQPNVNPYFDQKSVPPIDVPPASLIQHNDVDSGMPAWMPLAAPLVGLGLFALLGLTAFGHHGEAPPTQGGQHAANAPQVQQQPAVQPQETQPKNLPQAQQQGPQNPGDPRPGATKPETTGEAPKQQ
ncbi:MAG: hypothetical protein JO254_03855 [Pseudolabrys sp.]|nr:hypothetical protein [Pseudolabrys sp.]